MNPNYLAVPADLERLVQGVKLAREIFAAQAFSDWVGPELQPGPEVHSDNELRAFVRQTAGRQFGDELHHARGPGRGKQRHDDRVDYECLPVVVDAAAAIRDGAPQLHDEVPHNLNALWTCGDREATERAIASAEVVVTQTLHNQRTINNPIEPRGALGSYDAATGEYTLWASSQSPHNHRLLLAYLILGIPFNKLRVIAPKIGGSFGTKGYIYPDMPLVLFLARELGRPVKWVDTRTGLMQSTVQGRDQHQLVTLAGTRDGKITALRCTSYANLGAYPSTIGPGVVTAMMGRSITGMYQIPNAYCEVYAAFTNIVPLGAQRGSGRAEATFLIERMVDEYAAQIGLDSVAVRRKNLIAPDQFPYDNGLGWKYDSGDYEAALDSTSAKVGRGSEGNGV